MAATQATLLKNGTIIDGTDQPGWTGDLLMVGAAFCMALYNVWSRPFIHRSGPIPFATLGMGIGALCLIAAAVARDGFAPMAGFSHTQFLAVAYLGIFGGAIGFFLWAYALGRASPTRVAVSVTVNPVTASLFGAALLGEAIGWNLVAGLVTVIVGIWLAMTEAKSLSQAGPA